MLQVAALLLAFATMAAWLSTGANRGWTKTSVPVEKRDEVTGLSYREYERRIMPGLEVLVAGLCLAGVMGGVSMLCRRRTPGAVD
jgi:hypothetical protein